LAGITRTLQKDITGGKASAETCVLVSLANRAIHENGI
jgi:hypothetical protein